MDKILFLCNRLNVPWQHSPAKWLWCNERKFYCHFLLYLLIKGEWENHSTVIAFGIYPQCKAQNSINKHAQLISKGYSRLNKKYVQKPWIKNNHGISGTMKCPRGWCTEYKGQMEENHDWGGGQGQFDYHYQYHLHHLDTSLSADI